MSTQRLHDQPYRRRLRREVGRFNPARLLPTETRGHLRNAAREQLLAVRSILDAVIARLERPERNAKPGPASVIRGRGDDQDHT